MKSVQVFNTGDLVWISCRTKISNTWIRRWARPWIFTHRYQIGWTVLMPIFV